MKKLFLLAMMSTMLFSCKKEEGVKPISPPQQCAQYSETDYYLANNTYNGERDTIKFTSATILERSLHNSINEPLTIQLEPNGFYVVLDTNSAGTMIVDGIGSFTDDRTMTIYWRAADPDGSNARFYESVYCKVKL